MSKDKALPAGFEVDDNIAEGLQGKLQDGMLSCASAHALAKLYNVPPAVIGNTADALNIRLNRCQLGLFGYPNKKGWDASGVNNLPVPEDFKQALSVKASATGSLTCAAFWEFIAGYKLSRMHAGYIAEKLGIRITNCQIGAF